MLRAVQITLACFALLTVAFPAPAAAQTRKKVAIEAVDLLNTLPVTGTIPTTGGTFTGTFDLARIGVKDGQLVAIGTLSGTLRDAAGNVIGTLRNVVAEIPLTRATGTCSILHLELGPVDLDLLGLVVHLDKVVLDITAQTGPGQLLGNLLCGIANLLNNSSPIDVLAQALNSLLRTLN